MVVKQYDDARDENDGHGLRLPSNRRIKSNTWLRSPRLLQSLLRAFRVQTRLQEQDRLQTEFWWLMAFKGFHPATYRYNENHVHVAIYALEVQRLYFDRLK